MEQLVLVDPLPPSDLDDLVKEIDRRLDPCFLRELEDALDRARNAGAEPSRS